MPSRAQRWCKSGFFEKKAQQTSLIERLIIVKYVRPSYAESCAKRFSLVFLRYLCIIRYDSMGNGSRSSIRPKSYVILDR